MSAIPYTFTHLRSAPNRYTIEPGEYNGSQFRTAVLMFSIINPCKLQEPVPYNYCNSYIMSLTTLSGYTYLFQIIKASHTLIIVSKELWTLYIGNIINTSLKQSLQLKQIYIIILTNIFSDMITVWCTHVEVVHCLSSYNGLRRTRACKVKYITHTDVYLVARKWIHNKNDNNTYRYMYNNLCIETPLNNKTMIIFTKTVNRIIVLK